MALRRNIAPAIASGRVVVDSCERYIIVSLCSIAFRIGETRRPSGREGVPSSDMRDGK